MTSTQSFLSKKLNRLEYLNEELKESEVQLNDRSSDIKNREAALAIMQKSAKVSQDHLAEHLSSIVTHAIQAVIKKPYTFVCEFVERRGSTEADLYLMKDGEKYDILDGTGGGLADVCSFSLKVAYLLLSNVDRVLIMDEISRHVNSKEQRTAFAEVVKRLSTDFNMQLIINSTIPELLAVADKVVELEYRGGRTQVK